MDLLHYTLLSVSVASTLGSLVLAVALIGGFMLYQRVSKILTTLETMAQAGLDASHSMKEFVEHTTIQLRHVVQTFTTLEGAKEVAGFIGDTIRKAKQKNTRKEKRNGPVPTR